MIYVLLLIALGLALVHRVVGRRYLDEYVAVYGRMPSRGWFRHPDPDETVEGWRRKRLAVLIPEIVAFLGATLLLLQPVGSS